MSSEHSNTKKKTPSTSTSDSLPITPLNFLLGVSIPLFIGSVLGYRRQLDDTGSKSSKIVSKITGKKNLAGDKPLSLAQLKKLSAANFNPSIHAGRALMISTGITVSVFGCVTGLTSYALRWYTVEDWINGGRRFGRSIRTGMVNVFGEDRVKSGGSERKLEEEKVRKMSREEEGVYWSERIFGKEEEEDEKNGESVSLRRIKENEKVG